MAVMDWVLIGTSLFLGIIGSLVIRLHYRRGVSRMLDLKTLTAFHAGQTQPLSHRLKVEWR